MHLKTLSAKWRPFCLSLNVLILADSIPAEDHTRRYPSMTGPCISSTCTGIGLPIANQSMATDTCADRNTFIDPGSMDLFCFTHIDIYSQLLYILQNNIGTIVIQKSAIYQIQINTNPSILQPHPRPQSTLQWCHNDHDGVSNHQPHGCLLNRLFRSRSKKTSKLRVTGLCVGNSPGPVNSPYKGPITQKMFPFDDVIMNHQVCCMSWVHLSVFHRGKSLWNGHRIVSSGDLSYRFNQIKSLNMFSIYLQLWRCLYWRITAVLTKK